MKKGVNKYREKAKKENHVVSIQYMSTVPQTVRPKRKKKEFRGF
jgi:hypothetical protein